MMQLKNKRIFIVEDNPANLLIMQVTLEQHGAKTMFERWGQETIERLRAAMPIDVIIMDLMFPDNVTGYDVFANIRKHAEFANIPIVAVSASDPTQARTKTKEQGFAGFIGKPIDYDVFPRQIAEIINKDVEFFTA
jgi:CheY-like chemotaxis protein